MLISEVYVPCICKYYHYRAEKSTEKQRFSEMAAPMFFPLRGGAFNVPFYNISRNIPLQSTRILLLLERTCE